MEFLQSLARGIRESPFFYEVTSEMRQFWTSNRIRLAVGIVLVTLILEVLIAAAFYAGAEGMTHRGSENLHAVVVSFFGLSSQWAKAIFVAESSGAIVDLNIDIDLRDPYQLTRNLLHDVASMLRAWLLPLFAALAFTDATPGFGGSEPSWKRLLRRSAVTVGPLALADLVLMTAGVLISDALPYLFAPVFQPSPYPVERLLLIPWEYVGDSLLGMVLWLVPPFILIPTVAAASRERPQALAACFGTNLFLVPVLTMAMLHLYPGGAYAVPPLVLRFDTPLISLALFAVVLPFALRRLSEEPSDA
jgi:hypothetical protein